MAEPIPGGLHTPPAGHGGVGGAPAESWWPRMRAAMRDIYCLSPRVQVLLDAELRRADILGAGVGLFIALFLGMLYLVSPKALDAATGFRPVPWVVALFLALSLLRLRLAWRAPLTGLAQTTFILTDVGLLYVLIWSFHIQYAQPPAFYLKAPTFLFVFLLIAVRALRFEPLAVMTTGLTAAAGWALMTIYAISSGGAITRDFIDYLTSNAVLVGAEVEKIIAILLVTAVLMLALLIGRRALVMAARGTTERNDLARFFAPEVAARITAEDQLLRPGFGEVRSGAVLVSDIRGFTALVARRQPSEVVGLLVAYQRRMTPVIRRHNGMVDKFLGDGILATFGCTSHSHRPAADAVAALVDLCREADAFSRDAAERFGEPVRLGFAVVSGEVLCGTVGDGDRLEFTVVGDAVNQAVKLEKANKTFGTLALVDVATLEAAREQGFPVPRDALEEHAAVLEDGRVRRVVGWRDGAAPPEPLPTS